MKKFLSLALALVMTMSMVTISASATFADDASITYEEAVDVMYDLDIIGGYADGSFAPTGTLTRGAAAKIICNMILGPTVADALGADTAPFPDVAADHTFAGYIAYCVQQGILSGYSDGNFYPALEVNGNAFMKMLLCALGYDSDIEGFTGANWSVNVAKLALSLGLDDGDDVFQGTTAITREEACLYALNAMEATMVEYPNTTSVVVGDISITTSSSYSEVYNNQSNDYRGYSDGDEYMQFCEKYFSDLEQDADATDSFGRPAVTWENDGDDIGTYVNSDTLVESFEGLTSKDDIFEAISEDVYDDIDDGEYDLVVYVDGVEIDEDDYSLSYWVTENSSTYVAFRGSNTDVFVDDDEDVVTLVIINTYLVQASDDYDSSDDELDIEDLDDIEAPEYYTDLSSYSLSFQSSIDNDDVYVEDFEEDDYILVTIADSDIQTAALADVVTGEVSTYSTSSSVTIDGEKYNYSKAFTNTDETYDVGEEAGVVLDEQGHIIYIDDAIIASDRYVFVDAFDYSSSFSTYVYYAAAYFSDGTYAEIQLDELLGDDADDMLKVVSDNVVSNDNDASEKYENRWYTYTTNSDGTYDLTEVEDDYFDSSDNKTYTDLYFTEDMDVISSGSVTFAKYGENIGGNNTSIKGNSDTVFIVVDEDDDVYMFTGVANVADVTTGDGEYAYVYAILDGTYADFVFVDASHADVDGASSADYDYMFVVEYDATTVDADGDTVYEYTVIIEDEEVAIISTMTLSEGYLYEDVDLDSNGYIDDAKKLTSEDGTDSIYVYSISGHVFDNSSDILDAASYDFIVGDDADVYVVVNGGVPTLLKNDGADYEIYNYSTAKSVVNFMDDYAITGRVAVVVDDDESADVVDMFIYVTSAYETPDEDADAGDDYVASTNKTLVSFDADAGTLEWYVEDTSITAITNDEIYALLVDAGWTVSYEGSGNWNVSKDYISGASVELSSGVSRVYAITIDGTTSYETAGTKINLSSEDGAYYYYSTSNGLTGYYTISTAYNTSATKGDIEFTTGYYAAIVDGVVSYYQVGDAVALTGNYYTADSDSTYVATSAGYKMTAADVTITSGLYKLTIGDVSNYYAKGDSVDLDAAFTGFSSGHGFDGNDFYKYDTSYTMPAADTVIETGYSIVVTVDDKYVGFKAAATIDDLGVTNGTYVYDDNGNSNFYAIDSDHALVDDDDYTTGFVKVTLPEDVADTFTFTMDSVYVAVDTTSATLSITDGSNTVAGYLTLDGATFDDDVIEIANYGSGTTTYTATFEVADKDVTLTASFEDD